MPTELKKVSHYRLFFLPFRQRLRGIKEKDKPEFDQLAQDSTVPRLAVVCAFAFEFLGINIHLSSRQQVARRKVRGFPFNHNISYRYQDSRPP